MQLDSFICLKKYIIYSLLDDFYEAKQTHSIADTWSVHMDTVGTQYS